MGMDIGEIGAALFERMDGLWVSPNHPNQDMTAGEKNMNYNLYTYMYICYRCKYINVYIYM